MNAPLRFTIDDLLALAERYDGWTTHDVLPAFSLIRNELGDCPIVAAARGRKHKNLRPNYAHVLGRELGLSAVETRLVIAAADGASHLWGYDELGIYPGSAVPDSAAVATIGRLREEMLTRLVHREAVTS